MGKLGTSDRCAILLRYFQNKSLHEVGLALGTSEDTARMRINRALEKLRRFFEKRGVRLSALALAGALSTKSVQAAPEGLATSISTGIAQGAVIGGSVAALAHATLRMLAWARLKMLLGLSATAISVAAGLTTFFLSVNHAGTQQAARAGTSITKVAPFQSTSTEGFDRLGITEATKQQISIFGGSVTISNLTPGGALKLVYSSELGGVLVKSRSSPFMLGQLGISEWVFKTPITRFGAYFQNNSRFDDATVDFYDVNNELIGSVAARVPKSVRAWTWNGWQSDVPIRRLVITGNDAAFLHGFIWFDDVAVAVAPRPPAIITRPLNVLACNVPGSFSQTPRSRSTNGLNAH